MKRKENILEQLQYEQLVQLSLVKYLVTQPKELCGLIKHIKKHKALFTACKKIMKINDKLVMLFTQHPTSDPWLQILFSQELTQEWQIEARQKYLALCDELAGVIGISAARIEKLHKSIAALTNLFDFRRACIELPETSIRDTMQSMKTDPEFQPVIGEIEQHLFVVMKFVPGKSINQVVGVTTPLIEAIYLRDITLVKSLAKSKADPCFQPQGAPQAALNLCLGSLQPEMIRYFSKLDAYKKKFKHMFFISVMDKKFMFVRLFVETGFYLDVTNATDYKVLQGSLVGLNAEMNALILPGCKISELDADQKVELIKLAAGNPDKSVLKLLLDQGIDINMLDAKGQYTALFHICIFVTETRDAIINMVENGANIEFISPASGSTPLVFASQYGREDSIRTLVELGANIHPRNNVGADALLQCVDNKLEDLAFELIQRGASIDRIYENGLTLCYLALQSGCVRVAKYLITNSKIDFNSRVAGFSYLHAATASKQVELLDLMLTKGIDLDQPNDAGLSPIRCAVELGANEIALRLIDAGAQVPQNTVAGLNFLSNVFRHCDLSVPRAILAKPDFDINTPDAYGYTAVTYCQILKGTDITIELFSGRQICQRSKRAYSPLVGAILDGADKLAVWLVEEAGMSVDHHCRSGHNPLYAAIYKGNLELVRFLLQHGAPILQVNGSAYTPLMQACSDGFDEIAELLIEAGAEVNQVSNGMISLDANYSAVYLSTLTQNSVIKNNQICALDLAARGQHHAVVDLLLHHGAILASSDPDVRAYIEERRMKSQIHNAYLQESQQVLAELFATSALAAGKPTPSELPPVESLPTKILRKLKAGLGDIPKNDLVLIAERLETSNDDVIAKEVERYRSKRDSLVQKIRVVERQLLASEDANTLHKRMPNTAKLHTATLSTLRGIHQKLCRLNSGVEDSNAPLLPSIPTSTQQPEAVLAPAICYPGGYKLQDFPGLHEVRRGDNICVIPCLDLLSNANNLTIKEAFERELVAPKLAREKESGLKGIEGYSCEVDINGETCLLPLGFELKISSSKARILFYCLEPIGPGPVIAIPAIFKAKGLHSAADKDKSRVYQAPPLADFLAIARKALLEEPVQEQLSLSIV